MNIEVASASRPQPGKEHDRIFIDKEKGVFAVFDGAANALASDIATKALRSMVRNRSGFNPREAFTSMQFAILTQCNGKMLTTASLVCLTEQETGIECQFASAGDSSIYSYNHARRELRRWTEDESEKHENHIDARNFLGSWGHKLQQVGKRILEQETTLALLTDGITEPDDPGRVTDEQLADILRESINAEEAAQNILSASSVRDDATVLLVAVKA